MHKATLPLFGLAALACAIPSFADDAPAPGAEPQPVLASRDIGDPEANIWEEGGWPTTPGEFQVLDERPSDPAAPKDHKALRLIVMAAAFIATFFLRINVIFIILGAAAVGILTALAARKGGERP